VTASGLPPPPIRFPAIQSYTLRVGTELHRTHAGGFRPAEFNPCRGQPMRFSPIEDEAGRCVPSLYDASSREAAAFESIFHDIDARAAFKTIRQDVVEIRAVSRITNKRALCLASLFTPDLKAWGLARSDLIDTSKFYYRQTAPWAAALHGANPDIEGLVWTSRQCDPDLSFLMFGDRVAESDFDIVERRDVGDDAALLLELRGFGKRAGITIVS
jgi:hypothetical protein